MGIVSAWAGNTHLVNKVGYHRALDILLSARSMNSDYAKSIALIDSLIALPSNQTSTLTDESLLEKAVEIIEAQLGHLSVEVIRGIKSALLNATRLSYADAMLHERDVFVSLWGKPANLAAFDANVKHA